MDCKFDMSPLTHVNHSVPIRHYFGIPNACTHPQKFHLYYGPKTAHHYIEYNRSCPNMMHNTYNFLWSKIFTMQIHNIIIIGMICQNFNTLFYLQLRHDFHSMIL